MLEVTMFTFPVFRRTKIGPRPLSHRSAAWHTGGNACVARARFPSPLSPLYPLPHIPTTSASSPPAAAEERGLILGGEGAAEPSRAEAMGQQQLIYAFVARGTVVLAEYTEFTGNFTTIAAQCLQKLPASNNKFTYNCDGHTFNYLVEDGFTYCVVAVESVGRQIPIAFLDRVKEDFTKKYGGGKAATAAANSLNREFGSKLKEHMQYCVDHPEEVSKLAKVKAQVSEVKGVMMENIEKVLY
jgi:vesicle-associated membrane protein 72